MMDRSTPTCGSGDEADGRMEALPLHAAREAAAEGRGMGHQPISYGSCHDDLRRTTFYKPPHDIRHPRGRSMAGGIQAGDHRYCPLAGE
jgi:hypothetical protein